MLKAIDTATKRLSNMVDVSTTTRDAKLYELPMGARMQPTTSII